MLFKRKLLQAMAVLICILISSCLFSCESDCSHIYSIHKTVEATCTEEGYKEYKCSECKDRYRETIPAVAHTPGPEPSLTQEQRCTRCNTVLKGVIDYMTYCGEELTINHYFGYSKEDLIETVVDTRYHGTYHPEPIQYLTQNGAPLPLNLNIPIQEFFSHIVLSISPLSINDGKTYNTTSGFKVAFDFTSMDKNPEDLFIWDRGLSDEFVHIDTESLSKLVKIVGSYPADPAHYKTIYEVVDFSSCYIEIAKETEDGYITLKKIESQQDWKPILETGKIEISDNNGELFFGAGTYRILFKYDMIWATDSASPVYKAEDTSKSLYPYGRINSQYESFYVTVTEEKSTVLLPSNIEEGNSEMFCQLRALSDDTHLPFVPEYSTLNFGESIVFNISAKLDANSSGYLYSKKPLSSFYVKVSVYNENTDTYDEYKSFDLMDKLSEGVVQGKEISLDIGKDGSMRKKKYKISVSYTIDSVYTQQNYYYTVDW